MRTVNACDSSLPLDCSIPYTLEWKLQHGKYLASFAYADICTLIEFNGKSDIFLIAKKSYLKIYKMSTLPPSILFLLVVGLSETHYLGVQMYKNILLSPNKNITNSVYQ